MLCHHSPVPIGDPCHVSARLPGKLIGYGLMRVVIRIYIMSLMYVSISFPFAPTSLRSYPSPYHLRSHLIFVLLPSLLHLFHFSFISQAETMVRRSFRIPSATKPNLVFVNGAQALEHCVACLEESNSEVQVTEVKVSQTNKRRYQKVCVLFVT